MSNAEGVFHLKCFHLTPSFEISAIFFNTKKSILGHVSQGLTYEAQQTYQSQSE